jgi:DNA-binding PadR family transcriptional regulator
MTEQTDPNSFLPLTPAVFHILLALADGEKHGYAIMKQVTEDSDGAVKMGPGTLYGSIKRMLAAGLIAETEERPDPRIDDQRRRYYRLTDFGGSVVTAELRRLSSLVEAAQVRQLIYEAL